MGATNVDDQVLGTLRSICPSLENIKLDKKRAESFLDLLQVFECHTRSTDYMIQFFKEPVVNNCSCKGCNNGVIKVVRMPTWVYENVMALPMPMPVPKLVGIGDKETDFQYMSFADAHFTSPTSTRLPWQYQLRALLLDKS